MYSNIKKALLEDLMRKIQSLPEICIVIVFGKQPENHLPLCPEFEALSRASSFLKE